MSDYDWSVHLGSGGDRERHPIIKWDEEGKTCGGLVTDVWDFKKDDKVTPVLTLESETETVSVFASQVDLRQKLAERNPQVGDVVKIRFDGTERLESGNTMKRFSVRVDKPPADDGSEPF